MNRLLCLLALVGGTAALLIPIAARAIGDEGADGDFAARESFHFSLYQDVDLDERSGLRGSRQFEQQILRELESAYDLLDSHLGLRPEEKIVVYVWDPGLYDARFQGLFRFPAAGFYRGAIHVRGDEQVTDALVRVLHHELVHAAFDAEAPRLDLPAWMNEGIAEWFEARASGQRKLSGGAWNALVQAARRGTLFSLSELSSRSFAGFSPEAAGLAYLQSYGFIDHLVQAYGQRGLVRFWSAVIRSGNVDRGARRAYQAELSELDANFRRSLGVR